MNDKLRQLLIRHEGRRLFPYTDTVGKLTIGIGRNLTDNGITEDECEMMLNNDVIIAMSDVQLVFPEWGTWTAARQDALTDMMFNLGITKFYGFKKMIAAISAGNWSTAAAEMRNSLWANQVGARATELSAMVDSGAY